MENLELEEEYYAINQTELISDVVGYILNKNKKYQKYKDRKKRDNFYYRTFLPLEDIVRSALDVNEEAMYYCLHDAEKYAKDIVYNEKRDYNRAIKSLKKMFKDFKIINNGEDYTCSTRFIMPLENK